MIYKLNIEFHQSKQHSIETHLENLNISLTLVSWTENVWCEKRDGKPDGGEIQSEQG